MWNFNSLVCEVKMQPTIFLLSSELKMSTSKDENEIQATDLYVDSMYSDMHCNCWAHNNKKRQFWNRCKRFFALASLTIVLLGFFNIWLCWFYIFTVWCTFPFVSFHIIFRHLMYIWYSCYGSLLSSLISAYTSFEPLNSTVIFRVCWSYVQFPMRFPSSIS